MIWKATFISLLTSQTTAKLPRSYYPEYQKLDLIWSSQNKFSGSTLIHVANTYTLSNQRIVFNVYDKILTVKQISLFEGWGNPEDLQEILWDYISYNDHDETYTVGVKGNFREITLHLNFETKVSGWLEERFGVFPIYYDFYEDRTSGLAT